MYEVPTEYTYTQKCLIRLTDFITTPSTTYVRWAKTSPPEAQEDRHDTSKIVPSVLNRGLAHFRISGLHKKRTYQALQSHRRNHFRLPLYPLSAVSLLFTDLYGPRLGICCMSNRVATSFPLGLHRTVEQRKVTIAGALRSICYVLGAASPPIAPALLTIHIMNRVGRLGLTRSQGCPCHTAGHVFPSLRGCRDPQGPCANPPS